MASASEAGLGALLPESADTEAATRTTSSSSTTSRDARRKRSLEEERGERAERGTEWRSSGRRSRAEW
jgi:hypothetical protein